MEIYGFIPNYPNLFLFFCFFMPNFVLKHSDVVLVTVMTPGPPIL